MDTQVTKRVFQLTKRGDLDALKKLVKSQKIDLSKCWIKQIPTSQDWSSSLLGQENEFSVLHMAAATSGFSGHGVELMKYFIEEHHLDPNMTNREGDGEVLPLHEAVQYGSVDAVRYFIDKLHMDPMLLGNDDDNMTLLHLAAQGGQLATVKYFVEEKSIDPEVKDSWGRTPLYMCLYDIRSTGGSGGLEVIKYFAETHKVDLMKPVLGATMVHLAAPDFDSVPNVLKYMVETAKCDPLVKNRRGETPAEYAVRVSSRQDKNPVVEYLAKFVE